MPSSTQPPPAPAGGFEESQYFVGHDAEENDKKHSSKHLRKMKGFASVENRSA
jgi:hypothetical protein